MRTELMKIGTAVLVFSGAFAGGFVANRAIPTAHAQTLPPTAFRGQSVTVVDPQGRVQASLRTGATGGELVLHDTDGKTRVTIGPSGIVIKDQRGRVVWTTPTGGFVPAVE
jgi:hypothetical protein